MPCGLCLGAAWAAHLHECIWLYRLLCLSIHAQTEIQLRALCVFLNGKGSSVRH